MSAFARRIVSAWIALFCSVSVVLAAEPLPDLRDLNLTKWNCLDQPEGSAREPGDALRNRMKNRNWVSIPSANVPQWSYDQFVQQTRNYDAALGAKHREHLSEQRAAKLASFEKQIVSLTGWIVLTYPGPKESCNCRSREYHDWHLEVVPAPFDHSPGIGDPTAIICEITPRTEGPLYRDGVRLRKLAAYFRRGEEGAQEMIPTGNPSHKVRITGYLMWDDAHEKRELDTGPRIDQIGKDGYSHPWRATAWEIHPVLKIELLDDQSSNTLQPQK